MSSRNFYARDILKLAFPIIFGNLGFIMIGVGDVIVAGRHSTDTLAAISIANAITNCILMLGIGILVTISAILSNYRGEGKNIEKYFCSSIKFAMILGLAASCLILGCIPFIDKLGFDLNLTPIIKDYFFVTAFATFGGYLHCAMKEYLQAFEIVIFPNLVTIFCIFLNLVLNILFVFGYGPIPEMGAIGLAISSLIVRYFMGIVLLIYCLFRIKVGNNSDNRYYKDIIKVGLPASLAIMIEFTGFNIISVVMGKVAGIYAAAHMLIFTFTSVSFMIPLAISNAAAVKVGYSNGAKDYSSLKKYACTGISISVSFMAFSALMTGMFADFWTGLFTRDIELIKICVPIVYLLCFFQIFDGLQVSLSGIFRGIKQTTMVMISNFVGYWLIAFPLGCVFAFKLGLNLFGFWCALLIASAIICAIMGSIIIKRFKKLED